MSCTRRVCITVANRKMKVFKLLLQISGLCPVLPIRICLLTLRERFAVQHFIDAIKDKDDKFRLCRDKPRNMDEALSLACELEAFRLLDGVWRGSSPKVRSVDEVDREPDLLKLSWKCYVLTLRAATTSGDSARCSSTISSADTTAPPVNVSEHL